MASITDSLNIDDSLGEILNSGRYLEFLQTLSQTVKDLVNAHNLGVCRNIMDRNNFI